MTGNDNKKIKKKKNHSSTLPLSLKILGHAGGHVSVLEAPELEQGWQDYSFIPAQQL